MKHLIIAILSVLLITACGSETEAPQTPEPESPQTEIFSPESKNIQTISLIDVNGNPVSNTNITITKEAENKALARSITFRDNQSQPETRTTDANGNISVDELTPGTYSITLEMAGTSTTFTIVINEFNAQDVATIAAPVAITGSDEGEQEMIDLSDQGIFFAVSGVIYDAKGPIIGAQIEISGGQSTNGSISTTLTDANGEFVLIINVGLSNLAALESASIRIFKEGYISAFETDINAVEVASISGVNIELLPLESNDSVIYHEGFDQTASGSSCGSWASYSTNEDIEAFDSEANPINLWHEHQAGLEIINQALSANLVLLAPNDTSEGYIPDPTFGNACWYGEASAGSVTQGNFLGSVDEESDETPQENIEFSSTISDNSLGGTSEEANEAALESPLIDLSNEVSPISLSFKTWWEIESVNPNESGYDVMSIQYKEGSNDWETLAKLNPLSDPVTSCDVNREPLPYSNAGYNKAPLWLSQEPISLDSLAGKVVKLRLKFSTRDQLFNGFRGWLVDELSIQKTQGTFPLYISSDDDVEGEGPDQSCDPEYSSDYDEPT